jgi:hypothetical protein
MTLSIFKKLKGKKTYIAAGGLILSGAIAHLQGEATLGEAIIAVGAGLVALFQRKALKDAADPSSE